MERENLHVEDLYKLQSSPSLKDRAYELHLTEFEQEKTTLKDINLVKIEHPQDVEVGVLDNEIIYYKDLVKPDQFRHNGEDVSGAVEGEKGDVAKLTYKDVSADHNLLVSEASLRGGRQRIKRADKILSEFQGDEDRINQFTQKAASVLGPALAKLMWKPTKACASIHFYLESGEEKEEIAVAHPREKLSENLVDLEEYNDLLEGGVNIGLKWTDTHNIEVFGLAKKVSASEVEIKKTEISPDTLVHSEEGECSLEKLRENEINIAPGDSLRLEFPVEEGNSSAEQSTTYLIRTEGYYRML